MRNLLDAKDRQVLFERAARLTPESEGRWGKMDVGQMVCHVTDPMRIALGEIEVADVSTFLTRHVLKPLVLAGMPPPKGKVETYSEIDQAKGGGTQPTTLEADLQTFRETVDRFVVRARSGEPLVPSPAFGPLRPRAYGRLIYVHTSYHWQQFGV